MTTTSPLLGTALSVLLVAALPHRACCQAAPAADHHVVLEAGAAGQRPVSGGPSSWGASVAAELTPHEGGLEYEVGFTAVGAGRGEHESSVDLLLMKSWPVARAVEFMVGLGPELAWHGGATALSVEAVAHVMYWPWRTVGLFAEPGLSIQPVRDGERSIGLTVGALLALR